MSGKKNPGQMDDDMDTMETANLISNSNTNSTKPDTEIPLCGCMSVRYYQPYFDVNTSEVTSRLYSSLLFCRAETTFMQTIIEKPDAYGPFWIATTLIFTLAVTSHISSWMSSWLSGHNWQYDFNSVVSIAAVVYSFLCCVPTAIWFLFRQLETNTSLVSIICVYGYSLTVFIPASLLCLAPSELIAWLSLTVAALVSGLFLVRNYGPIVLQYAPAQASLLIGAIGLVPVAFMLTLKLGFYSTS